MFSSLIITTILIKKVYIYIHLVCILSAELTSADGFENLPVQIVQVMFFFCTKGQKNPLLLQISHLLTRSVEIHQSERAINSKHRRASNEARPSLLSQPIRSRHRLVATGSTASGYRGTQDGARTTVCPERFHHVRDSRLAVST